MNGTILLVMAASTVALFAGCDGIETGGAGAFGGSGNWGASGGARSTSGGTVSGSGGARSTSAGGAASTGAGTISCSYKASTIAYCVTAPGTASDCVGDSASGLTAQLVTSCPTGALLTCDVGTTAEPATAYFYDVTTVNALEAAFPSDPCEGFTSG